MFVLVFYYYYDEDDDFYFHIAIPALNKYFANLASLLLLFC